MASLIPPDPLTRTLMKPAFSSLAATIVFVANRLNPESEILATYHLPLRTVYLAMSKPFFSRLIVVFDVL